MSDFGKQAIAFVSGAVVVIALVAVFVAWLTFKGGGVLDPPKVQYLKNKTSSIAAEGSLSFLIPISDRRLIEIDVVERFGKNIEFRLLVDGTEVEASGVARGRVHGRYLLDPGMASLVIENDNLLEAKHVVVNVSLSKTLEGG